MYFFRNVVFCTVRYNYVIQLPLLQLNQCFRTSYIFPSATLDISDKIRNTFSVHYTSGDNWISFVLYVGFYPITLSKYCLFRYFGGYLWTLFSPLSRSGSSIAQVRKIYLLHKPLIPGAAKQQNSTIINSTATITIRVATPWLFACWDPEDDFPECEPIPAKEKLLITLNSRHYKNHSVIQLT